MRRWLSCWPVAVAVAVLGACGVSPPTEPAVSRADPSDAITSDAITSGNEPTSHARAQAHKMRGTDGDDELVGGSGRDIIDGLRGTDILRGGAGNDELSDYTGVGTGRRLDTTPDTFYGGPGDDLIHSGHNDRVHAGPGNDRVVANYLERGDVVACGPGWDVVVLNDDDPGIVQTGCETVRIRHAG